MNDIGLLTAVAVLRTALNFILERELRQAGGHKPLFVGEGKAPEHPPLSDAGGGSSNASAAP